MNNKKQPYYFLVATTCLIFSFLLLACSRPPTLEAHPTIINFTATPDTPTKQPSLSTVQPQVIINTTSPTTISRITTFEKFDYVIDKVVFSDDGKTLAATGGKNDKLIVWNVDSGKELLTLDENNDEDFALSPDGRLLASTTWGDSWITIRDTKTGEILQRVTVKAIYQGLAFSPDGRLLAIGGSGTIWLWDIQQNKLFDYLGPQSRSISKLAFSRDGKQLVSVGDLAIELWDLSTKNAITTIRLSPRYYLYWGAAISPGNPDYIAIPYMSSYDSSSDFYLGKDSVVIWNISQGKLASTINEFRDVVIPIAISPDARYLALSHYTNDPFWDISSSKAVIEFQPTLSVFAFSADGNFLAIGKSDGIVELWDISQLK